MIMKTTYPPRSIKIAIVISTILGLTNLFISYFSDRFFESYFWKIAFSSTIVIFVSISSWAILVDRVLSSDKKTKDAIKKKILTTYDLIYVSFGAVGAILSISYSINNSDTKKFEYNSEKQIRLTDNIKLINNVSRTIQSCELGMVGKNYCRLMFDLQSDAINSLQTGVIKYDATEICNSKEWREIPLTNIYNSFRDICMHPKIDEKPLEEQRNDDHRILIFLGKTLLGIAFGLRLTKAIVDRFGTSKENKSLESRKINIYNSTMMHYTTKDITYNKIKINML